MTGKSNTITREQARAVLKLIEDIGPEDVKRMRQIAMDLLRTVCESREPQIVTPLQSNSLKAMCGIAITCAIDAKCWRVASLLQDVGDVFMVATPADLHEDPEGTA